jgi:hypothetical protein
MDLSKLAGALTDEEVIASKNEILNQDFSSMQGWELFMDLSDAKLYRTYLADRGMYLYKSIMVLNFDVKAYFECYVDNEYRKVWDHTALAIEKISEESGNDVVSNLSLNARLFCVRFGIILFYLFFFKKK